MDSQIQRNLDALFTLCERAFGYEKAWGLWLHYGLDVTEIVEVSELWPVDSYGKMSPKTFDRMLQYCVHIVEVRRAEALGRAPHQDRATYYSSSLDAVVSLCESVTAYSRQLPTDIGNRVRRQASYVLGSESAWDKLSDQVDHMGDGKKVSSSRAKAPHAS